MEKEKAYDNYFSFFLSFLPSHHLTISPATFLSRHLASNSALRRDKGGGFFGEGG